MVDNSSKGGRKPRAADRDILDVFRSSSDPVLSTAEVAESLPIKRRATLNRLRRMSQDGDLKSKQIGGRNTVWWLVEDVQQTPREPANRTPDTEPKQSLVDTSATTTAAQDVRQLGSVDFPTGKDREKCIEAINAAREYLRIEGPATMREIVSKVHPNHPIGYDVDKAIAKVEAGERYRGAWWRRIVKPGLEAADDIQTPAPGQSDYRHTGGD